jgi:hypothetical protein
LESYLRKGNKMAKYKVLKTRYQLGRTQVTQRVNYYLTVLGSPGISAWGLLLSEAADLDFVNRYKAEITAYVEKNDTILREGVELKVEEAPHQTATFENYFDEWWDDDNQPDPTTFCCATRAVWSLSCWPWRRLDRCRGTTCVTSFRPGVRSGPVNFLRPIRQVKGHSFPPFTPCETFSQHFDGVAASDSVCVPASLAQPSICT